MVVLGGGIKGSAIAALGALNGLRVTIVEREKLASGATSHNHGRLHGGTSSWKTDNVSLMRRRYQGSKVIRSILPMAQSAEFASYCFQDSAEARLFELKAEQAGIPVLRTREYTTITDWIDAKMISDHFRVEEFSFDPAQVSRKLAGVALELGASIIFSNAETIETLSGGYRIGLANGDHIYSDCVVNALSAWADLVKVPKDYPKVGVDWFKWSLVCACRNKSNLPNLDRVISFWQMGGFQTSVIPHQEWFTLDTSTTSVLRVDSPELHSDWRPMSDAAEGDVELLWPISNILLPIQESHMDRFFRLTGIHARKSDAQPGSSNTIYKLGGYYISFGGQASTAILDAENVVERVVRDLKGRELDKPRSISCLAELLQSISEFDGKPMRWLISD